MCNSNVINDDEKLILKLVRENESMKTILKGIHKIASDNSKVCVCIGGPLNDNNGNHPKQSITFIHSLNESFELIRDLAKQS